MREESLPQPIPSNILLPVLAIIQLLQELPLLILDWVIGFMIALLHWPVHWPLH